jgi:hypothetical protein
MLEHRFFNKLLELRTTEEQAVVDLIKIATAFTFLHEVRHAMYAQDINGPSSAVEEEYGCDRYAWSFLMERISEYCDTTHSVQEVVVSKRLMGMMLGLFVILEATPEDRRSGSGGHPPLGERFRRLVQSSSCNVSEYVWVFGSCLLFAIFRKEQKPPSHTGTCTPQGLFEKLVSSL